MVIDPHSCRESAGTSFKNLHARYANHRPSLESPVTTALRRIERLLETGFVAYSLDPKYRRRKYIELTDGGATKIQEVVRASRAMSAQTRHPPPPTPDLPGVCFHGVYFSIFGLESALKDKNRPRGLTPVRSNLLRDSK